MGIVRLIERGGQKELCWGCTDGGQCTVVEFASRMTSYVAQLKRNPQNRVVMRCHSANLPAMTAGRNLDKAFGVDTTGMDQAAYRKAAVDAVRQLSVDVGIPTKLEKLKEEDLPFLCQSAAADACAPGNPHPASLAQFEEMFRKLM